MTEAYGTRQHKLGVTFGDAFPAPSPTEEIISSSLESEATLSFTGGLLITKWEKVAGRS